MTAPTLTPQQAQQILTLFDRVPVTGKNEAAGLVMLSQALIAIANYQPPIVLEEGDGPVVEMRH